MVQDKTNIFKLSEKQQKEYQKAPFFDCMPGAEDFAKALKKDILTKETPYVLLLEKNYGMGKTFFLHDLLNIYETIIYLQYILVLGKMIICLIHFYRSQKS